MQDNKPTEEAISNLNKDFKLMGTHHVHSWYGWAIVGIVSGMALMLLFVANQNAQFSASNAAVAPKGPAQAGPAKVSFSGSALASAVNGSPQLSISAIGKRLLQLSTLGTVSNLSIQNATFGTPTKKGIALINYAPAAVNSQGLSQSIAALNQGITGNSAFKVSGSVSGDNFEYLVVPDAAKSSVPRGLALSSIIRYVDPLKLTVFPGLYDGWAGGTPPLATPDDRLCWCSAHQNFKFDCGGGNFLTFGKDEHGKDVARTTTKRSEAFTFSVGVPGSGMGGQDTTEKCPADAATSCSAAPCILAVDNTGINGNHLCAAATGRAEEKQAKSTKISADPITAGAACKDDAITETAQK